MPSCSHLSPDNAIFMKKHRYLKACLIFISFGFFTCCASHSPMPVISKNIGDGFPPSYTDAVTGIEFIRLLSGTFTMGSPDDEAGRDKDEGPAHLVSLDAFYIGKYEVTQAQWEKIMGKNRSTTGPSDLPVVNISWFDVHDFLTRLNKKSNIQYRLPTEAEWEYACRAGSQTAFSSGNDELSLKEYAWFDADSGGERHPVGIKKPNQWGLYDIHGNVCEWVGDGRRGYLQRQENNPVGPSSQTKGIHKGGCWLYPANLCRSANRNSTDKAYRTHIIGFRLAFDKKVPETN